MVFTYFASFTGYEDDILEVISYLHVQGSKFGREFDKFGRKIDKFGRKIYKFGGKPLKKLTPRSSWSLFFPSLVGGSH